jgi:hypothetical protein
MSNSLVPGLTDALVAAFETAFPDISVLDGQGITEDPRGRLMVGIEDPDEDGFNDTAEIAHDWAGFGSSLREQMGTLWCVLETWNGDSDLKAARDAADGDFATIRTLLRTDATIAAAVPGGYATVATERWSHILNTEQGAVVRLAFQVGFKAIA